MRAYVSFSPYVCLGNILFKVMDILRYKITNISVGVKFG
jgi:hypothetical protein